MRAIEMVAIDQGFSISDCLAAIGREDLTAEFDGGWTIRFPAVGPPELRRG